MTTDDNPLLPPMITNAVRGIAFDLRTEFGASYRGCLDDPLDDHRQDQITLFAGFAIEQFWELQAFGHGQDGFHMPVRQSAFDLELILGSDVCLAGGIAADEFNAIVGEMGQIGDGFFFDFAVFSVRVHEEVGHVLSVPSLTSGRHYMNGTAWEPYPIACQHYSRHTRLRSRYIY
jgi:hypothetical protein